MTAAPYRSVYDFGLLPYALGDVLTWNVQTAIRCEELGRSRVDAYVCVDESNPACIFQRGLVTPRNQHLYFRELFEAFGTHPMPGNLFVFRRREEVLAVLRKEALDDPQAGEELAAYEEAIAQRTDHEAVNAYFVDRVHSHERVNAFAARHGRVPLLRSSLGCDPDISGLFAARFAGRRVVAVQVRLRRLDAGYGGEHTYVRDSDFLAWYEFLKEAQEQYPDVQFVMVGRVQEKPLELLKLPNVISLRPLGLGLGHELSLILRSDLFMGTSSGFAAMANFSTVPYFITRVTPQACKAYGIEFGAPCLPFATGRQRLVYEPETAALLMRLLVEGLAGTPPGKAGPGAPTDGSIDVRSWEWERSREMPPDSTTSRFFTDDTYADKEVAYLVWPALRTIWPGRDSAAGEHAWALLTRIESAFPRCVARFPEFLRLKLRLAADRGDHALAQRLQAQIEQLATEAKRRPFTRLQRWLARAYPLAIWLRFVWRHKHRIPRKLLQIARGLAAGGRT